MSRVLRRSARATVDTARQRYDECRIATNPRLPEDVGMAPRVRNVVIAIAVAGILGVAAAAAAAPAARIAASYDAPMEIGLTAGGGGVWFVTSGGPNGVVGVDPRSGKRFP